MSLYWIIWLGLVQYFQNAFNLPTSKPQTATFQILEFISNESIFTNVWSFLCFVFEFSYPLLCLLSCFFVFFFVLLFFFCFLSCLIIVLIIFSTLLFKSSVCVWFCVYIMLLQIESIRLLWWEIVCLFFVFIFSYQKAKITSFQFIYQKIKKKCFCCLLNHYFYLKLSIKCTFFWQTIWHILAYPLFQ